MNTTEKTEYRIIPYKTYIGDLYLQFKTVDTVKKFFGGTKIVENWRFVPQENRCVFLGSYLNPNECPTAFIEGSHFLHCFHNQENYSVGGLIPFTKKWPNINDYFEKLKSDRTKHLLKKETEEKNAKVIYL